MTQQLDRIEAAINGQEGLIARTARIEEKIRSSAESANEAKESAEKAVERADIAVEKAADTVRLLTSNIEKLEGILSIHLGTDHLSVLMKKKQFWSLIVVAFIGLHLIATYIPNLFNAIILLLGLPKLLIPLN